MNTKTMKRLFALITTASLMTIGAPTPSRAAPETAAPRPPAPPSAPSHFNSDLFKVDKQIVEATETVGEIVRYRLRMDALGDIEQVQLLETLPPGLDFVESNPAPAESKNGAYLWTWPSMTRGTSKEIIITVRPTDGGWFVTSTKVAVIPTLGMPIFAGRAKLELAKTGPAQAELGDTIDFRLEVTNVGNAPARDVIVTDTLPAGLYGPDRSNNVVSHKIGTLPAGETRVINIPVKAAVRGEWDNRANAFSTHQVQANATAHLTIVESKLAITKTGPDKAFVFSNASYYITLVNEGANMLNNIQLTDQIPEGAGFVSASDGGTQAGQTVTWTIPSLAPGESVRREVVMTSAKLVTLTATATARFSSNRTVQATATTLWEGAPGILTEIVDDTDPVKVGANVTYTVKITNQSPIRELTSNAIFDLAPNMRFLEVSKNIKAGVTERRIVVENITLKPRGVVTFKIVAQAVSPGLGGVRFEYGSNELPRPVIKEEVTYVY